MKLGKQVIHLSPPLIIAGGFGLLIILGTLLLKLPIATVQDISWTDAFFVATSATTVTGLSVFDPGTTLTLFGEIVLLVLIQFGGVGLMTFAVLIFMLLGKKVGLQQRIYIQESFNQTSIGGVMKLAKSVLLFVFIIESIATLLLTAHWSSSFGLQKAFYFAIFHVISAFNNAGFALFPDNLMQFVGDPVVNIILSLLFIVGGLGFTVVLDIYQKNSFRQYSLHTKIMLLGTIILNVVAILTFFILEYTNPATLGPLNFFEKVLASYFQGVSPRTAGFNTLSYENMHQPTILFTMFLMFIGAGSASTASGIKVTTFIIVILTTLSFIRGRQEPEIFGRSIKLDTVIRSLAITAISLLLVSVFVFLVTVTETLPFLPLAFEVFSAFGTVGLTMGVTDNLTDVGEVLISFVMFVGRIGSLTLFFLILKPKKENYRYPYEQVYTG